MAVVISMKLRPSPRLIRTLYMCKNGWRVHIAIALHTAFLSGFRSRKEQAWDEDIPCHTVVLLRAH